MQVKFKFLFIRQFYIFSIQKIKYYELCGVFWRVHHDDYEIEGPSIDRDNLW